MTDRVYVTYSQPLTSGPAGIPFYHMQIHYEKNDQSGNVIKHETIDFGPKHPLPPTDALNVILEDMFRPSNSVTQFGLIWAATNPVATPEKPTDPYELIAEGNDLSSNWAAVLQSMQAIVFDGYAYKPLSQNSNTAGNTALVAGGFRPASGKILDPVNGIFDWYPVPGLSDQLQAPIGVHAPVWMPLDGILYSSVTNPDGTKTFFAEGSAGLAASGHFNLNGAVDQTSVTYLEPGIGLLKHLTSYPANGTQIDTAFGPNGILIEKKTDLADRPWKTEIETAKDNKPVSKVTINDDETVGPSSWNGAALAGNLGAYFGSQLGQVLGGNSVAGKLAAGTVLGAIGSEVGKALTMGASYSLQLSVQNVFGTLGGSSNIGSLEAGGIAAVSSLLIGELAQELDLGGVGGALFNAMGTTVTSQLITNAWGVMTGATYAVGTTQVPYTMFTGFDPATIAGSMGPSVGLQLSGAVGGVLGSTLAAHIAVPQHAEGAVGQQIGSSIGGMLGAFLLAPIPVVGPIMGSFLGSFVGGVVGSLAGALAGNDPVAHGRLGFAADHRFYADPTSFWDDHGGNAQTFQHMAVYTANTVNALADFAGVQMNAAVVTTAHHVLPMTGLQLRYGQDTRDFWINDQNGSFISLIHNVDEESDLAPMVDAGIMGLVRRVTVAGGDPLVRLAWDNSTATGRRSRARCGAARRQSSRPWLVRAQCSPSIAISLRLPTNIFTATTPRAKPAIWLPDQGVC